MAIGCALFFTSNDLEKIYIYIYYFIFQVDTKRLQGNHWPGAYAITRKRILARLTVMSPTSTLIHAPLGSHTMAGVLCLSIGISSISLIINMYPFNLNLCIFYCSNIPQFVTFTEDLSVKGT
jgi:hypothetical protein